MFQPSNTLGFPGCRGKGNGLFLAVLFSLFFIVEGSLAQQSRMPDQQQVCNSCLISNQWRDNCPNPQCCSALDRGPIPCCHEWRTCCDEYSCWQCCARYETHTCGHPHHPATVWCGHWCHTCNESVLRHGECSHTSCQYCSGDPHARDRSGNQACGSRGSSCNNYPPMGGGRANVLDYFGCL